MKTIQLNRLNDNGKSTTGELLIDDMKFVTIEDTFRHKKIKHETRIPAGNYRIILRKFGGHHERYSKKFLFHKGMLQLENVPGFSDILIHIGNTADDSSGCILIGKEKVNDDLIRHSTLAYAMFYQYIINLIKSDEEIFINITDNEKAN